MALPTVIAVGSVAVELQLAAARWPEAGETLPASEFSMRGGGNAADAARAARRLGAKARLVARVGYDLFAHQVLGPLAKAGVELGYVERVPTAPTGVAVVLVGRDGRQPGILLAANANAAWRDEDEHHIAAALATTAWPAAVVIDADIPARMAVCAAELARHHAFPAILVPSPAARVDDRILANVDFVTPNAIEAERLTGARVDSPADAVRAAHTLLSRGCGTVVVRLRDGDCVCVDRLGDEIIRAPCEGAADAGGAFAAALAVALLDGRAPFAASRFAAAATTSGSCETSST